MMVEYHWNGILWTHLRERVFRAWSCGMYLKSAHPVPFRVGLCVTICFWTFYARDWLLRSVAFHWVVVLCLSAVNLAFAPNLINRSTEEILWWRNGWVNVGKCVLCSQPLTWISVANMYLLSMWLYLICCIYFVCYWSKTINSFWYGDDFTVANAKDWSQAVPFGGRWEWGRAEGPWVGWEWAALGSQEQSSVVVP